MDGQNQIQKKCKLNKKKNWLKPENQNKNNNKKNNKLNKQQNNKNKNSNSKNNRNRNNSNRNKKMIKNLHLQMLGMIWKIKIKRIINLIQKHKS